MCKSAAEGGQRCHTGALATLTIAENRCAALGLDQETPEGLQAGFDLTDAQAKYASTPEGEADLLARMGRLKAADPPPVRRGPPAGEAAEFHAYGAAIAEGRRLRTRAREVCEAVRAGTMTGAQAAAITKHPNEFTLGYRAAQINTAVERRRGIARLAAALHAQDLAHAMIPREGKLADYYEATDRKHFGDPGSPGSTFTHSNMTCLDDLVAHTAAQRPQGLDGDDQDQLIAAGADPAAFTPGNRYLLVRTSGTVSMRHSGDLPDQTAVRVVRTKPGTSCSLVMDGQPATPTTIGTVIIGPHPDDPTREVVYTAHPGLPTPYDPSDRMAAYENQTVTLAQVRAAFHGDVWLTTTPPA